MTTPYVPGYDPMVEMFPMYAPSLVVESGLLSNGEPCVSINDMSLTEDEVMVLVRHLMVNLEYARHLHFENQHNGGEVRHDSPRH